MNLERLRENCYERLSSLHPEDSHISILTALEERVNEGLDHESRMDEVALNRTLSLHFEEHENDHALIRWLLEAEFLETEDNGVVDAAPNRTITDDLNDDLVSADGLPLHISSNWTAHGRGESGTMGPAARLLCYWVRGEFLGSCSVNELCLTPQEEALFIFGMSSPRRTSIDKTVLRSSLAKGSCVAVCASRRCKSQCVHHD